MRYTMLRELAKVTMQVTLTFACMNLKKLAIWKWRAGKLRPAVAYFLWWIRKTLQSFLFYGVPTDKCTVSCG